MLKNALRMTLSGIAAGLLITVGGTVFLAVENRYVGAGRFSVALLCICIKGYSLYTGRIGLIPEKHGKEDVAGLFLGLLGNALATLGGGLLIAAAFPAYRETAKALCTAKLETQTLPGTFIRACFCGLLMYLAVSIYKSDRKIVGVLFCIPVFILSGFEHSVADMYYFSAAGIFTLRSLLFIAVVVLGNSVGAVVLPLITDVFTFKKKEGLS